MKPTKNVSSSSEKNQGNWKQNIHTLAAKAGDASKERNKKEPEASRTNIIWKQICLLFLPPMSPWAEDIHPTEDEKPATRESKGDKAQ